MIGDDPVRYRVLADRIGARGFRRRGNEGFEQVGLLIVVAALHDGGDALKPHAGVD